VNGGRNPAASALRTARGRRARPAAPGARPQGRRVRGPSWPRWSWATPRALHRRRRGAGGRATRSSGSAAGAAVGAGDARRRRPAFRSARCWSRGPRARGQFTLVVLNGLGQSRGSRGRRPPGNIAACAMPLLIGENEGGSC
jgi:hypothetical protein